MSVSEEDIRKAFEEFDVDGNGTITLDELKMICEKHEYAATNSELESLISKTDTDGDGKIQYSEFRDAFFG